jgi:hypothetical protein
VLVIRLFTELAPVLQGISPKKVWYPLSVAESIFLGQVPRRIGHFLDFSVDGSAKSRPCIQITAKNAL